MNPHQYKSAGSITADLPTKARRHYLCFIAPQVVFGRLSLLMLGAAAAVAVVPFLITISGTFGEIGMGFTVLGIALGGFLCIASFMTAMIGLTRRESPRWPAITGLVLSILPALGGVCLLCRVHWL